MRSTIPQRLLVMALSSFALGCAERPPVEPQPLHPDDVRLYLTDQASTSLDASGRFVLPDPPEEAYPQISPERAGELAVVFASTYGPMVRSHLERQHRRPIDFGALRVGSPVYYAASPYEPVPPHFSPGMRNVHGPQYLLYLVYPDGTPVLSVNVAAFTEAWIEEGQIRFPTWHGGDFGAAGIPAGDGFQLPVSPEQAARLASRHTGASVAGAPEFLLAPFPYTALHSRWRIRLDRPVEVRLRTTGEARAIRELYVGLRGQLFVPSAIQPDHLSVDDVRSGTRARLPVREHRPVEFVPVSSAR
jgi:hypothetical protein